MFWLNTPPTVTGYVHQSMEFIVSYYLTVILNSLQRFVKDLVPIQYRNRVFRFPSISRKYKSKIEFSSLTLLVEI